MREILERLGKNLQEICAHDSHFILLVVQKKGNTNGGSEELTLTTLTSIHDKVALREFLQEALERVDERFTSKMALQTIAMSGLRKKARQNKERVDAISATIILQSYLEKQGPK